MRIECRILTTLHHPQTNFALCALGVLLIWIQPPEDADSVDVPVQPGPVKVKIVHVVPAGLASSITVMLENLLL